ncbi:MAG: hypothetical protein R3F60_11945 [bacterium]
MNPLEIRDFSGTLRLAGEEFLLSPRSGEPLLGPVGELATGTPAARAVIRCLGVAGLAQARAALRLGAEAGAPPKPPSGRPTIRYVDGFGRGVRAGWWLIGRSLRLSGADATQDVDVEVAAAGLPDDHGLPPDLAASALAAARARAPLPCACGTDAQSPLHHGSTRELASARDEDAPVEVRASVHACTVCGTRWVFTYEGDTAYEVRERALPSQV